ncbi:hypothetical protein PUR29_32965 [Methylobacterium ajmalii]|uniref:Uncharacterized protein n=1 Tax=Methylobacterium ajmalii TaxID=2738439 RepID=A0ABV0A3B0_9HYPH
MTSNETASPAAIPFMRDTAAQRAHFKQYERQGMDYATLRNLADVVRRDINRHEPILAAFVEADEVDAATALEDELTHARMLLRCLERAANLTGEAGRVLRSLRGRVMDQLAFCREPAVPEPSINLTAEDIRAIRREELGVRFAVYRTYRRAMVHR